MKAMVMKEIHGIIKGSGEVKHDRDDMIGARFKGV